MRIYIRGAVPFFMAVAIFHISNVEFGKFKGYFSLCHILNHKIDILNPCCTISKACAFKEIKFKYISNKDFSVLMV
jgi:hypothetical protein